MTVSMFKRFVEPGRLALITFGPCTGKMYFGELYKMARFQQEEMGVSRGTIGISTAELLTLQKLQLGNLDSNHFNKYYPPVNSHRPCQIGVGRLVKPL
jgi:hypothetical protein